MIRSMTGYGKVIIELEDQVISIEMKSVNHRFLDTSFKMPRHLFSFEDVMKRMIKKVFTRGKIEIYILINGQGLIERNLQVDWNLLEQYMNKLQVIKSNYSLKGDITIDSLLKILDVFEVEEKAQVGNTLEQAILEGIDAATSELEAMRAKEGAFLKEDINERLRQITMLMEQLDGLRSVVARDYQERLNKRLKAYVDYPSQIDEMRLHQEVAILIEKGDITEELVRLKSHVKHMENTLEESGGVGRKLDFICQEMLREANTIGAKSTDGELDEVNIKLKSEIEKIKEQVQNIE